jgi:cell division transport system permease protein
MKPKKNRMRTQPARIRSTNRSAQRRSKLVPYLTHHLQMLIASLGYLSRSPVSSLMTSAVVAISLALPAGLYVALENAMKISAGWDGAARISLFLTPNTQLAEARALADRLRLDAQISRVDIIDRDTGLKQFQQISGFGDAIKFLDENPLPHVITVQPYDDQQNPDRIVRLVETLQQEKQVELAQLDMQWVQRLYTLLDVARRAIWIIGSLLGLAVLLIVGNTIRLDIQNRREVIQVSKLIGASNAFIRRPFLYTGLWYGLFGGLLAWLLVAVSLGIIAQPVQQLATLYYSDYQIMGLTPGDVGILVLASCLLGWLGSWLAVGRHLKDIEPS